MKRKHHHFTIRRVNGDGKKHWALSDQYWHTLFLRRTHGEILSIVEPFIMRGVFTVSNEDDGSEVQS